MKTEKRKYPLPKGVSLAVDYPLIKSALEQIDKDIDKLDKDKEKLANSINLLERNFDNLNIRAANSSKINPNTYFGKNTILTNINTPYNEYYFISTYEYNSSVKSYTQIGFAYPHIATTAPKVIHRTKYRTGEWSEWTGLATLNDIQKIIEFTKPKIGHAILSNNSRVDPGWKLWQENDIEAQIADYPKLVKEYQDGFLRGVVTNVDLEAGTFTFKGHGGRYWRPAGSAVAAGSNLGDAIRNITGYFETRTHRGRTGYFSGAFYQSRLSNDDGYSGWSNNTQRKVYFNASRVVPTASENRPKTRGMFVLIYHGEGV